MSDAAEHRSDTYKAKDIQFIIIINDYNDALFLK